MQILFKTGFLILICIFFSLEALSQKIEKIDLVRTLIHSFETAEELNDFRSIRKKTENRIFSILNDNTQLTEKNIQEIKITYDSLSVIHNEFVDIILSGLIDKRFSDKEDFLPFLQSNLNKVNDYHNQKFNNIISKYEGNKSIAVLIGLGKLIVPKIFELIQNNKSKNSIIRESVRLLTMEFSEKIKMKKFDVLLANYEFSNPNSKNKIANNTVKLESIFFANENVTIRNIEGSIELFDNNNNEIKLLQNKTTDFFVLTTYESFDAGSKLYLNINTDGYVYLLAKNENQNGTKEYVFLYPKINANNAGLKNINEVVLEHNELSNRIVEVNKDNLYYEKLRFPINENSFFNIDEHGTSEELYIFISKKVFLEYNEIQQYIKKRTSITNKEIQNSITLSNSKIIFNNNINLIPVKINILKK